MTLINSKTKTPKQISAFDLDHTLLSVNSSFKFGAFLYQKKQFSLFTMLYLVGWYSFHKIGLVSMTTVQQKIFSKLFLGKSSPEILAYAKEFVERDFEKMLYLPAIQKLKTAKLNGHYTVILSSSPLFLVKLIAKRFEVDDWDGTLYELDTEQKFVSVKKVMQGIDKAVYMDTLAKKLKLDRNQLTAYSDSHLDLPFLESAGTAVAVNPNKVLRKLCQKKQWQIL